MKVKIDTQKKVRLVPFNASFRKSWFIEGTSVKEVLDLLMSEPVYLNNYIEEYPNCVFKIYEYELGKLPYGCTAWDCLSSNYEVAEDLAVLGNTSGLFETLVYFNQKILLDVVKVDELIKKHKGYKNAMNLVNDIHKQRKFKENETRLEQIRIRKENDIFTLAKMMKVNKDFKKMLKEASKLESKLAPEVKLEMVSLDAFQAFNHSILKD